MKNNADEKSANARLRAASPAAAEPSAAEIARLAFEIWEKEGRPEGRDLEHWMMARHQLLEGNASKPEPSGRAPGN